MIGAGGLGCPAALYLAAAGIGRLTIADSDQVDLTNLQRQILYRTDSVGAVKVDAARSALNAVNPDVAVVPLHKRVKDFSDLAAEADVVLDCSGYVPDVPSTIDASLERSGPTVKAAASGRGAARAQRATR